MDIDEDEDTALKPKKGQDFGIEVDFNSLDDDQREVCLTNTRFHLANHWYVAVQDGSAEAAAEFDDAISKINAEIERMAPNMKAVDR